VAAPAAAHAGQHRLDHGHGAKHIDLELADQLGQRRFLEDALVTIAGVVDQHVDRSHVLLDPPHGRRDVLEVSHVEDHGSGALAVHGLECRPVVLAPHRADHGVAGAQRRFGEGAAQARAGAGDQEDFCFTQDCTP